MAVKVVNIDQLSVKKPQLTGGRSFGCIQSTAKELNVRKMGTNQGSGSIEGLNPETLDSGLVGQS